MHLPERLGQGQGTRSNTQRKRHTKRSESRGSHSDHDDISHNSYEKVPQNNSSIGSQASTRVTDSVDVGDSLALDTPPNLPFFMGIPDTSAHGNFARFLGPDSIEDLFGQQDRHAGSIVSPNLGSTAMDPPQNVVSLDQYVSVLDLQNGLAGPQDVNNCASGVSSLHCGELSNASIDHTGQPFIPLSPYIMQMHPSVSNFLVSPESYAIFTDDYCMVDTDTGRPET